MIGGSGTRSVEFNKTYFGSLFGGGALGENTIPRATGLFPYALSASKFTNYVTVVFDGTSAATFTLLKNGASSGLAVSSGAGRTGYFMTSNVDHVNFDQGHTCANQVVGSAGTSVTWASGALLLETSA